jgi:hypothetical protein
MLHLKVNSPGKAAAPTARLSYDLAGSARRVRHEHSDPHSPGGRARQSRISPEDRTARTFQATAGPCCAKLRLFWGDISYPRSARVT